MGLNSELYNLSNNQPEKASKARSCAMCGGTASPNTSVFMPKAEVTVCSKCANDLYKSLAPKSAVIPVSQPTVRKTTVPHYKPYDHQRFTDRIRHEVNNLLLAALATGKT